MAAAASTSNNPPIVGVAPASPSVSNVASSPNSVSAPIGNRLKTHERAETGLEVSTDRNFGVAASVGHDNWASDVINAVENNLSQTDKKDQVEQNEVEQKVAQKKKKFHSGRVLELKNLPENCTEQDIRDAFPDLSILGVSIERHDGRYKPGAKLTLSNPEVLDSWPKSRQNAFVKNKEVSVCVGSSDGWLCLAKLPLDYTEEQFLSLAGAYGKVKEAFLMISEITGTSKGYGLIKYVSSDAAAQARHLLDGQQVNNHVIDCDWLNSSHITFSSLHSKALCIDNLPPNFRNHGEFREIFKSEVKNPTYCHIAMLNGVLQDWGLVDFDDPAHSELTQRKLNGYNLRGHKIRIHFCIPGVMAYMYMQAVKTPSVTKKKALMNDTPSANVYSQLQKLAQQNPMFAQNLQSIIQEQIRSLSSGRATLPATSADSITKTNKGNDMNLQQAPPTMVAATPSLNSNAQAALMILLTAQMQSQSGDPSLLQNNQVVGILQNLVNQAQTDPRSASNGGRSDTPESLNDILSNPVLTPVFGPLRDEGVGKRPALLGDAPTINSSKLPQPTTNAGTPHVPAPKDSSPTPPIVSNNLNSLLNTQNLSQLLGSLTSVDGSSVSSASVVPPPPPNQTSVAVPPPPSNQVSTSIGCVPPRRQMNVMGQRTVLLGDSPSQPLPSAAQGILPTPFYAIPQQPPLFPGLPVAGPPPSAQPGFYFNPVTGAAVGAQPPQATVAAPMFYQPAAAAFNPVVSAANQAAANQAAVVAAASQQAALAAAYNMNTFQYPPMNPTVTANPFATPPNSTKRKLPIPPSPEQSPDGLYIGQHSQGIGGHYADSYWRKKAKYS